MIIYKCDGCGVKVERPDGEKPHEWFERTWSEKQIELHACSRECIQKVADTTGSHRLVLPV